MSNGRRFLSETGTMRDVDAMIPAGTVLCAAFALDVAMARNPQARADYARIYGREWRDVGDVTSPTNVARNTDSTNVL